MMAGGAYGEYAYGDLEAATGPSGAGSAAGTSTASATSSATAASVASASGSVTVSAVGVMAVATYGGNLLLSTDFGLTWTTANVDGANGTYLWTDIGINYDGKVIAACAVDGPLYIGTSP